MTIEERDGKKGMEIRIVYGSPMGDAFGVAGDKGGFFWSSNFLQVYKEFASRKSSGVYADMNFFEISKNSLSRETRTTGLRDRHRARCIASKGSRGYADWRELACSISVVSGMTTSKRAVILPMSSSTCFTEYRFFLLRRYLSSRTVVRGIKPYRFPDIISKCFMILYGAVQSSRPDTVSISCVSQFTITSVSKNILFSLIYSLTLLCMVARSFLINSVDVISEGITSRYLPSNSFEIFFFAAVFGVGKCLMESIAFFRIVDMCCTSNIYLNSDIIGERVIKSLTV